MEFVACNISLFMCIVHLSGNKQQPISIFQRTIPKFEYEYLPDVIINQNGI